MKMALCQLSFYILMFLSAISVGHILLENGIENVFFLGITISFAVFFVFRPVLLQMFEDYFDIIL